MPGLIFDVRSNLGALRPRLLDFQQRQLPFATVYALTKTAQDVQQAEYAAMRQAFDRPTPFTLASLYVSPATKLKPVASVQFKEGFGSVPAWRYLGPEIEGGRRVKKAHERRLEAAGVLKADEYAVPGRSAKLDSYGNMRGSQIEQILSQTGAAGGSGYLANQTARSRRRNTTRARYFVMRDRGVPPGIYERGAGRTIVPVLVFVRQPRYAKRLPFRETAEQTVNRLFDVRLQEGIRRFGLSAPIPRAA